MLFRQVGLPKRCIGVHLGLSNKPVCFLVRGLPGVGKSTVCRYLSKKFGFIIIDPEVNTLFYALVSDLSNTFKYLQGNLSKRNLYYKVNLRKALSTLRTNKSFLWCQAFTSLEGLIYTKEYIENNSPGEPKVFIMELSCDDILIPSRVALKNTFTLGKLLEFRSMYEELPPELENITLRVNTSGDINKTREDLSNYFKNFVL